ncbi:hypothetical protein Nepgr_026835 [Nepenthes gracilis]|uniref:Uncharacterized protein n=1 Tax=Nepenthes gracilis TaxID=150966 RepID=A0AAD3TAL7_NEPGR|nr:hypothetical protein Nepgr_026835 [Nepenthes gracilis]
MGFSALSCSNQCQFLAVELFSQKNHRRKVDMVIGPPSWLSGGSVNGAQKLRKQRHEKISSEVSWRANAFPTPLVLAVARQPPDISVIIQTSAVMLFFYWMANFVVPQIVSKNFQQDQTSGNVEADGTDPTEEKASATASSVESSPVRKRGFSSAKRK